MNGEYEVECTGYRGFIIHEVEGSGFWGYKGDTAYNRATRESLKNRIDIQWDNFWEEAARDM